MKFNSPNLHYAFNVEYYEGVSFEKSKKDPDAIEVKAPMSDDPGNDRFDGSFKFRNNALCNFSLKTDGIFRAKQGFLLKTAYPGLLIGTGYSHGAGGTGDIDIGFSFDYVTGCPYIPGSSIKGAIRSFFKDIDYISGLLSELGCQDTDINELREEIFEGKKKTVGDDGKAVFCEIPLSKRDTFYDAYPETTGMIMSPEAITPHTKGPTKNPIPLSLMKVSPAVVFFFSFKLSDGVINKEKKRELFKRIILDAGLGAKTNTGFGAFIEKDEGEQFIAHASLPTDSGIKNTHSNAPSRGNNAPFRGNQGKKPSENNDVIICVDCNKKYTLSDYEQNMKNTKNYIYNRCKTCRDKKRINNGNK